MNIIEHKLNYLERETQFVAFTYDGKLAGSCDTLFKISDKDALLYEDIPFIASVKEVLLAIPDGEEVEFPCIGIDLYGHKGYFDFSFMKAEVEGVRAILWVIHDFTKHYEHLISLQQERNESEIKGEFLEIERKNMRLENELLEYKNKELERIQKLKSHFFANVSHEIRTPVNGIMGLTSLILENQSRDKHMKYAKALNATAAHLTSIVNDVLDLSKIEAGKLTFEKVSFSLEQVVNDVAASFIYVCQQKSISIESDIGQSLPAVVKGDPGKLSQILYNLVGNAVKFTEKGGINISLTYYGHKNDKHRVVFQVSDTGIGIPKEKLKSIFHPYEQAESNTSRLYGGTGLGLNIVKQLIELQSGSISVSSELEKGTTFEFYLDFDKGSLEEKEPTVPVQLGFTPQILIGEDDPISQEILVELCKQWGYKLKVVGNGNAVISALEEQSFDLVLLDYQLPGKNGYEICTYLKNEHSGDNQGVPVFLLSGDAAHTTYEQFRSIGVNVFLVKPVHPETLKQNIEAELRSSQEESVGEKDVDLTYLKDLMGGDMQRVAELVHIFIITVPEQVTRMKQFSDTEDWKNLQKVVHQSKSNFKYVGVKAAGEILDKLEEDIKKERNEDTYATNVTKVYNLAFGSITYLRKLGYN